MLGFLLFLECANEIAYFCGLGRGLRQTLKVLELGLGR